MMRCLPYAACLAFAALVFAVPAQAAGGAHVVDDAAVETPGACHLENWVTAASGRSGLVTASPACSRGPWPSLEIGGFVSYAWTPGRGDTLVGLSPKLALRSEERGVGVALAASLGYGIDRGRFESASVIVPVTIPAGNRVRLNLNAGWHWFREPRDHALFLGAQAEIAVTRKLNLMIEAFARDRGNAGGQIGLRWTPGRGAVDIDLIGGRYIDGSTRNAVSIGITVRR